MMPRTANRLVVKELDVGSQTQMQANSGQRRIFAASHDTLLRTSILNGEVIATSLHLLPSGILWTECTLLAGQATAREHCCVVGRLCQWRALGISSSPVTG